MSSNDHICEELFVDIFSRLPSKSLLRFRSLSKWSYACIGSPDFMQRHRTLRSQNNLFILMHTNRTGNQYIWPEENRTHQRKRSDSYTLHPENQLPRNRRLYKTRVPHPFKDYKIVGSCNGIICVYERRKGDITLWNPLIRRRLTIHDPARPYNRRYRTYYHEGSDTHFGFGYDQVTDDYKILKLSAMSAFVYSVNGRTWRKIAPPPTDNYWEVDSYQCLLDGALYYAITVSPDRCCDQSCILRFDLSSEVFTVLESPEVSRGWLTTAVTVIDGCLGLISGKDEVAWIWVRREKCNNTADADGRIGKSIEKITDAGSDASCWYVAYVLRSRDHGGAETRRVFQLTGNGSALVLERGISSKIVIDPKTHVKWRMVEPNDSCYIEGVSMLTESLELLGMGSTTDWRKSKATVKGRC